MPHSIVKFLPLEVTIVLFDAGHEGAAFVDPVAEELIDIVEDAPVVVDALLGATQSGS